MKRNSLTLLTLTILLLTLTTACSNVSNAPPAVETEARDQTPQEPPSTETEVEQPTDTVDGSASLLWDEPFIIWGHEFEQAEDRADGLVEGSRVYLLTQRRVRAASGELRMLYKLYEFDGDSGQYSAIEVDGARVIPSGFVFISDNTAYAIGPDGPVALVGYDLDPRTVIRSVVLTPNGYVVLRINMELHSIQLIHYNYEGVLIWERSHLREGLTDHRWGIDTMAITGSMMHHNQEANTLIVLGADLRGMQAISLDTGDVVFDYNLPRANLITSVAIAPDGHYYITGVTDEDTKDIMGVVALLSPEGVEIDRKVTRKSALVVVTGDSPDVCWFTEGMSYGDVRLYRWERHSDPVLILPDASFSSMRHLSLFSIENEILSVGRGATLLHAIRSSGAEAFKMDSLAGRSEIAVPIILGGQDGRVFMLASWDQSIRLLAIDLDGAGR